MNDDAIDEDDQAVQKGRFYVPQVECHSRYWSNISAVKKVTSKFFSFSSDVAAPPRKWSHGEIWSPLCVTTLLVY